MWLLSFIIIIFLEASIKHCFAQHLNVQYKHYLLSFSVGKYSGTAPALHTTRRKLPRRVQEGPGEQQLQFLLLNS